MAQADSRTQRPIALQPQRIPAAQENPAWTAHVSTFANTESQIADTAETCHGENLAGTIETLETTPKPLYKGRRIKPLPDISLQRRRWTVIASGLLCGALALVVAFTNRAAFFSPMALIVVAAIGSAAVLLQLRLRNRAQEGTVRQPAWVNLLGIVFAVLALFADRLGLGSQWAQLLALCAVGTFAVSSAIVLHAFRKKQAIPK
jgi:hypothetical protein